MGNRSNIKPRPKKQEFFIKKAVVVVQPALVIFSFVHTYSFNLSIYTLVSSIDSEKEKENEQPGPSEVKRKMVEIQQVPKIRIAIPIIYS